MWSTTSSVLCRLSEVKETRKKPIKFRINQNGLSVSVAKPTGIKLSVRGTRGIQEALVQTGSVCGVKHIDLTVKSAV